MRWTSVAVIIASVGVVAWSLPIAQGVQWLQYRVTELGSAGPIIFIAAYVVAAVLFVPGSALTIAAGALFGLLRGVVIVSIASTVAAAAAFLIARYLARGSVERLARRYPRFSAVDRAIGEGGWKIVALLRLSPVIPFNVSNYLFGLTSLRFWWYVLASWLAMLPATVLYVYLGHVGTRSVTAASGQSGRTAGEWVLLGIGLAATIAVTVYLTRLARRLLREQIQPEGHASASEAPDQDSKAERIGAAGTRTSIVVAPLVALLFVAVAIAAVWNRSVLQNALGPPPVQMQEAYEKRPEGPHFDHRKLDELLRKHVSEGGWVDYNGLKASPSELDAYIATIEKAPFDEFGRDEKLALLINAYNAFTLRLVLDYWNGGKLKSIQDIPEDKRWEDKRWKVGANTWSLNQIEHEQIRPKFREPRIHFALVCAAIGCPPLRTEAYTAAKIEEQLADQARYVHTHDRWFRFDPNGSVVHLTELYDWYGDDFKQVAASVLQYAAQHSEALRKALDAKKKLRVEWIDYDWRLNSQENLKK